MRLTGARLLDQDLREKALRRANMTQEDVSRGIEARAAARKVLLQGLDPKPLTLKPFDEFNHRWL